MVDDDGAGRRAKVTALFAWAPQSISGFYIVKSATRLINSENLHIKPPDAVWIYARIRYPVLEGVLDGSGTIRTWLVTRVLLKIPNAFAQTIRFSRTFQNARIQDDSDPSFAFFFCNRASNQLN